MSTSSSADSFAPGLFAGRRVLVVGGTSGIGAGIAAAFAALGAEMLVTGATAAEVERATGPATVLDVTDDSAVTTLIDGLVGLDVLVNCAGIIRREAEHDPAVFAQVLDVNLTGTMRTCTAARPLLAASRGCIVNTASMLSFFGRAAGSRLQRQQGRRRPAHQVPGDRLRRRRHPRERAGARLDRHAADPGASGRSGT